MLEKIFAPEIVKETPQKMSYEEYLALPHEGGLIEWVDGEVIFHMSAKPIHQFIVDYLTLLLKSFSSFFSLGTVISSPVEVRCNPDGNAREPDVLFLSADHLDRIGESRINGAPDLIVEVISDDSVARDLDDKFFEYQECGVPEYWIIDPRPRRERALFYQLGADGRYKTILPQEGIYHSKAIPGFWLRVEWLWEQPDPLLTVMEIAGFAKQAGELRDLKNR